MEDVKLERVHFRLPADGFDLLKEEASIMHMTDAALLRKIVMDWVSNPFTLDIHNSRPKLQATVQLPEQVAVDIFEMCEERDITRSALLRNIIMTTLSEEEGE